jgi:rubrerythrin
MYKKELDLLEYGEIWICCSCGETNEDGTVCSFCGVGLN